MMIEVFITNVQNAIDSSNVIWILKKIFPDLNFSFDFEHESIDFFPCQHSVLRVVGVWVNSSYIISSVNQIGFKCEVLEDKICT